MATENAMEDAKKLEAYIKDFMDKENIEQKDLYIDIQLELDEEDNRYFIDYSAKEAYNRESAVTAGKFTYENREEAWENYLDQLPELHQSFPKAAIKTPQPETYRAAKGGGNPAHKFDAESEI